MAILRLLRPLSAAIPLKLGRQPRHIWLGLCAALLAGLLAVPSMAEAPGRASSSSVRAPGVSAGSVPGNVLGQKSDSEIWRQVRRGNAFTLSGTATGSKVLMNSNGEEWRAWRNGLVSRYGGFLLLGAMVAIVLFAAVRGTVLIDGGRTGRMLPRFSELERMIHWFVAATFILLALSGLILMFGKFILLPIFGASAFGAIASAAMQGHNLFGPLFIFGIVAMLLVYAKDNLPRLVDFVWIFKGGLFFSGHASSWKYNMGEKIWFWIAMVGGAVLSTSGVLLDFPSLTDDPDMLRLASLAHGAAAVLVMAPALMHIYLGTVGVDGALEGMTKGEVDENWAIEHHDLWAEELTRADAPEAAE